MNESLSAIGNNPIINDVLQAASSIFTRSEKHAANTIQSLSRHEIFPALLVFTRVLNILQR
jgi:hypothetical protein